MPKKPNLKHYQSIRDFETTPEPRGRSKKSSPKNSGIFVVQKHDASHLHYDLRLEIEGTLKSWAVPKGPPTKIGDKRLAIETEDHPMEYANFEGVIPEGHYGAGTVLIWDKGKFANIKKEHGKTLTMIDCYNKGHIEVEFFGERL